MTTPNLHPLIDKITASIEALTPKGRILGEYIMSQPRKAVFMTTKELAEACEVSEATVVRFVAGIGYDRYSDFQQALRDFVDTELTLLDRLDIADMKAPGAARFRRTVAEEIDNLQQLYNSLDVEAMEALVDVLDRRVPVHVIGSRLSYTLAYYMGWAMTKVRDNIRIMKGSDRTTIDWLTIAPADSVVVIVATSRYPNELIRLGKLVKRLGQTLVVITDSTTCPVLQFADPPSGRRLQTHPLPGQSDTHVLSDQLSGPRTGQPAGRGPESTPGQAGAILLGKRCAVQYEGH